MRPKKYDVEEMIKIIDEYVDNTELPILKEVCYKNYWNYDTVMKLQKGNDELFQSIKRLLSKKETEVQQGGLTGKYNATMAVFTLKQLGWRDRFEVDANVSDNENKQIAMDYLKAIKGKKDD